MANVLGTVDFRKLSVWIGVTWKAPKGLEPVFKLLYLPQLR